MLPPPRKPINKKALPDARPNRQLGLRFQVNRLFDNEAEIHAYIKTNFTDKVVKIVKTWEVKQIACQIEVQDK